MLSYCSVDKLKSQLDKHLGNIADLPCQPGYHNSLYTGDCLNIRHYIVVMAPNEMQANTLK